MAKSQTKKINTVNTKAKEIVVEKEGDAVAENVNDGVEENEAPEPEQIVKAATVPCTLTLEKFLRDQLHGNHDWLELNAILKFNEARDVILLIKNEDGIEREFTVMSDLVKNVTQLTA